MIKCAIETLVVLVLQGTWGLGPQRLDIINDIILIGIYLFAILPLTLLSESYWHSHELTVFVEQALKLVLVKELLAVIVDIEDDVGSTVLTFCIIDLVSRTTVTAPSYGL